MKFRKISCASINGLEAKIVFVEIILSKGNSELITISGLPDSVIKESKTRLKAAIKISNLTFPKESIVINLSPADLKKGGSHYDLAFAAGILAAENNIKQSYLDNTFIAGQLSLNGNVLPIKGTLSLAIAAKKAQYKNLLIPNENYREALSIKGLNIFPIKNIIDLYCFLRGEYKLSLLKEKELKSLKHEKLCFQNNFSSVMGQTRARKAMEIVAAGKHNILLYGPPGSGKTYISKRLPSIMPPMTENEILEVTQIYSIAGLLNSKDGLIKERPFRAPHHTISFAGLVGGGQNPVPGEITLANHGVLFLDELLEFKKNILEILRQPIESREINISRNNAKVIYSANFILVAATNPCPCGNLGSELYPCICSSKQITNYQAKLSTPLNERIDIKVKIPSLQASIFLKNKTSESSEEILKRVIKARKIQIQRFKGEIFKVNAEIPSEKLHKYCNLSIQAKNLLEFSLKQTNVSARTINRTIKLARTIADINEQEIISEENMAESLSFSKAPLF